MPARYPNEYGQISTSDIFEETREKCTFRMSDEELALVASRFRSLREPYVSVFSKY
jgi:hypothetical protein